MYSDVRMFYFLRLWQPLVIGQDGDIHPGLLGGFLRVRECVAYGKDILSNSGVLAWTPVGKYQGNKDTSSSDASLECAS